MFVSFVRGVLSADGLERLKKAFPPTALQFDIDAGFDVRQAVVNVTVPAFTAEMLQVKEGEPTMPDKQFELVEMSLSRFRQLRKSLTGAMVIVGSQGTGKSMLMRMIMALCIQQERPFVLVPRFGVAFDAAVTGDNKVVREGDDAGAVLDMFVIRSALTCLDLKKHVLDKLVEPSRLRLEAALRLVAQPDALQRLFQYHEVPRPSPPKPQGKVEGDKDVQPEPLPPLMKPTPEAMALRQLVNDAHMILLNTRGILYLVDEHNEIFKHTAEYRQRLEKDSGSGELLKQYVPAFSANWYVNKWAYSFQYVFAGSSHSRFHEVMRKNGYFDHVAVYMELLTERQAKAVMLGLVPTVECAEGSRDVAKDAVSRCCAKRSPRLDRCGRLTASSRARSIAAAARSQQGAQSHREGAGGGGQVRVRLAARRAEAAQEGGIESRYRGPEREQRRGRVHERDAGARRAVDQDRHPAIHV